MLSAHHQIECYYIAHIRNGDFMQKKAFIQTYGCQMNEHDTHRMVGVLEAEGFSMTPRPEDAEG